MSQRILVDDETATILKVVKNSMNFKNYDQSVRICLAAWLHAAGQVQNRVPGKTRFTPREVLRADRCKIDGKTVWQIDESGDLDLDPSAARAAVAGLSRERLLGAIPRDYERD